MVKLDPMYDSRSLMTQLLNQIAVYKLSNYSYQVQEAFEISPTMENFESNTRAVLGNWFGGLIGNSFVDYRRVSLAENRPSVGNKLNLKQWTHHFDIENQIRELQKLIWDQVYFTYPSRPPFFGETQEYVITPTGVSTIYTPGSLTYYVTNRAPLTTFDPGIVFESIGMFGDRIVYQLPPQPQEFFASQPGQTEAEAFLRLITHSAGIPSLNFRSNDFVFSNVRPWNNYAGRTGNTLIDFDPGPGSYLSSGGVFNTTRFQSTPIGFAMCEDEVRNSTDMEFVRNRFFSEYLPMPNDRVESVSLGTLNAIMGNGYYYYRNLTTSIPEDSLLYGLTSANWQLRFR